MTIRVAQEQDAEELLSIYEGYVRNTAITFEYDVPSVEEFRRRIRCTLEKYPYLVAVEDGKIIGYTYAGVFHERAAYDWSVETSIYVSQDHRQQGVGRMLYEALEENLKKQGILNVNACIACPQVEDEYLTKDSVRFHGKLGYKMVGTFHKCGCKFNRWYDMVWMEKFIGEHTTDQMPVIPFGKLHNK